jgi:hypothetical protein
MVHWSQRAVLVAAAGACLTLSACGGSPATPSAASSAGAAGHQTNPVSHFCTELTAAMNDAPTLPPSGKISAAAARRDLARILRARVSGLKALEASSPPSLRASVTKIARVYKAEEQLTMQPGSIKKISEALVSAAGTGASGAAFRHVLAYVSANCR